MATGSRNILLLPAEIQAHIQSSITITTLNDVVIELVKNALDAEATVIRVVIDGTKNACEIEDNGCGIPKADFEEEGGLGRRFHTSKFASQKPVHGSQGQFLASLAALSLLSIVSKTAHEHVESRLILHRSRTIQRQTRHAGAQGVRIQNQGTFVSVYDLFGNLPVRTKERALRGQSREKHMRDIESLRQRSLALLLAWRSPVKLQLFDKQSEQNINLRLKYPELQSNNRRPRVLGSCFNVGTVIALIRQAYSISAIDEESWVTISARTLRFQARAALCLQPMPSKHLQFISVGIKPVDRSGVHNILFDEINRIFSNSAFGSHDSELDVDRLDSSRNHTEEQHQAVNFSKGRVREQARSPDRFPMFYIRIDTIFEGEGHDIEELKPHQADRVIEEILEVLRPLLWQFLDQHGFQPDKPRRNHHHDLRVRKNRRVQGQESVHDARTGFAVQGSTQSDGEPVPQKIALRPNKPSRTAFADWSRSKSSSRECLNMLGSVLPQQIRSCDNSSNAEALQNGESDTLTAELVTYGNAISRSPSSNNEPTSSDGLSRNGVLPEAVSDFVACDTHSGCQHCSGLPFDVHGSRQADALDQSIAWKDPSTGEVVRINARTGMVFRDEERGDGKSQLKRPRFRHSLARRGSVSSPREVAISESDGSGSSWLNEVLQGWKNPVFEQAKERIPSIFNDFAETGLNDRSNAASDHRVLEAQEVLSRLSRKALAAADVIGQVDRKFILVSMSPDEQTEASICPAVKIIVLIDQHAADERCRVEQLLEELCDPSRSDNVEEWKPIGFEITEEEASLFERDSQHFASWNIKYKIKQTKAKAIPAASRPSSSASRNSITDTSRALLLVETLPSIISERCRTDPKVLIDMLRTEVWARTENSFHTPLTQPQSQTNATQDSFPIWLHRLSSIPRSLLDLINSRACRSAIMFNDELTREECQQLVRRLARCKFPFVCAHGRKSCVPILSLAAAAGSSSGGARGALNGEGRRSDDGMATTGFLSGGGGDRVEHDEGTEDGGAWTKWMDGRKQGGVE